MERKTASELFHQVDPHLTVIDGGTRRHNKYRTHRLTNQDWEEATGKVCPSCGQESMRLVDGLCLECWRKVEEEREEKLGRRREKRYLVSLFNKGLINRKQLMEGRLL